MRDFGEAAAKLHTARLISRYWKDVSMGLRHIQNIPTIGYEIYGRNIAGGDMISPQGAF